MTDSVEESTWAGLIGGSRRTPVTIALRSPLQESAGGLAGSFRALGMDQRHWWVKPPHQGEKDFALVTEYVVGKAGQLIRAPTCENSVIEIDSAFDGWEFARGLRLQSGLGHATLEVEAAVEERPNLRFRNEDDNRLRHARIFALYDWCWGSDQQWLHSTTSQNSTFSHDHGFFFPPSGWRWDASSLRNAVDRPRALPQPTDGLVREDLWAVADELDKVDKDALLSILMGVPDAWPATDSELETLGWFLERRASAVASRMRDLL
jgi:hypothetical protein